MKGKYNLTIGKRIKIKRKNNGLTLKMLSEKCKLSISYLSDIEHGRRKPSLESLTNIAKGLNTTISILLEDEDGAKGFSEKTEVEKEIYYVEDKSLEFREVLQKIKGFESWSIEDREELLTYLKVKEKVRNSQRKK
jgi:transcriptional regulator with XRE-family HTH domain